MTANAFSAASRSASPSGRSAGPRSMRPGWPLTLTRRFSKSSEAGRAWDTAAMKRAMTTAPNSGSGGAIALPPLSAYRTASSASSSSRASRSPSSAAARKRSSKASRAASSASNRGRPASRCLRARVTSCREFTSVRSMTPAISAYSYPNTSRSRKAARSTGVSRSRRTSIASDSESASSARDAGPGAGSSTSGSGSHGPT